jgi:hypothetical protein
VPYPARGAFIFLFFRTPLVPVVNTNVVPCSPDSFTKGLSRLDSRDLRPLSVETKASHRTSGPSRTGVMASHKPHTTR